MSSIGLSYTPQSGSPVYNIVFDRFSDAEIARTYAGTASFSRGVAGSSVLSGPPVRQRYIWAISATLKNSEAQSLDAMFRAWDADRAAGHAAAIGIVDETFGDRVAASAVITTPPTFGKQGPALMGISIGLTEV